jgi:hypothetical protein
LVAAPAFWSLLIGSVAASSDDAAAPLAGGYVAFGLALVPFVFVVLAFTSEHPRAPGAIVRAMGLSLLVGIPVSALTADAVTGWVAGMGAGGIVALRADLAHRWKARAIAVLAVSAYVFALARFVGVGAVIMAPALPFTALGVADHVTERRAAGAARG